MPAARRLILSRMILRMHAALQAGEQWPLETVEHVSHLERAAVELAQDVLKYRRWIPQNLETPKQAQRRRALASAKQRLEGEQLETWIQPRKLDLEALKKE